MVYLFGLRGCHSVRCTYMVYRRSCFGSGRRGKQIVALLLVVIEFFFGCVVGFLPFPSLLLSPLDPYSAIGLPFYYCLSFNFTYFVLLFLSQAIRCLLLFPFSIPFSFGILIDYVVLLKYAPVTISYYLYVIFACWLHSKVDPTCTFSWFVTSHGQRCLLRCRYH